MGVTKLLLSFIFSRPFVFWGKRKTYKHDSQRIPGQSQDWVVYVFWFSVFFVSAPHRNCCRLLLLDQLRVLNTSIKERSYCFSVALSKDPNTRDLRFLFSASGPILIVPKEGQIRISLATQLSKKHIRP